MGVNIDRARAINQARLGRRVAAVPPEVHLAALAEGAGQPMAGREVDVQAHRGEVPFLIATGAVGQPVRVQISRRDRAAGERAQLGQRLGHRLAQRAAGAQQLPLAREFVLVVGLR